jgi:superfamily II DNA or RNA helicase
MPSSWKGSVIQYAGRIQRLPPEKREVRIYDYVDRKVPVLDRRFRRRLAGYRSIGFAEADLPPGYGEADDDWTLGRLGATQRQGSVSLEGQGINCSHASRQTATGNGSTGRATR